MLDADTVKTVARKVKPKSEETNARRCDNLRTLCMDILSLKDGQIMYNSRNLTHEDSTHVRTARKPLDEVFVVVLKKAVVPVQAVKLAAVW